MISRDYIANFINQLDHDTAKELYLAHEHFQSAQDIMNNEKGSELFARAIKLIEAVDMNISSYKQCVNILVALSILLSGIEEKTGIVPYPSIFATVPDAVSEKAARLYIQIKQVMEEYVLDCVLDDEVYERTQMEVFDMMDALIAYDFLRLWSWTYHIIEAYHLSDLDDMWKEKLKSRIDKARRHLSRHPNARLHILGSVNGVDIIRKHFALKDIVDRRNMIEIWSMAAHSMDGGAIFVNDKDDPEWVVEISNNMSMPRTALICGG